MTLLVLGSLKMTTDTCIDYVATVALLLSNEYRKWPEEFELLFTQQLLPCRNPLNP